MKLHTDTPPEHPDLHAQTSQSAISDEEYDALFKLPKLTRMEKVLQFCFFILTLGPLRLLLTFVSLVLFYLGVITMNQFQRFFPNPRAFKEFSYRVLKPIVRMVLFFTGIYKINIHGELHKFTRVIIANHSSMIDIVLLLSHFPTAFAAMSSLKNAEFIKQTANIFDVIFIDRTKTTNVTQQIVDFINDPTYLPMCIFPEGKITNGNAMLAFRTGAFLSEHQIQPITIRYKHWFFNTKYGSAVWLTSILPYFYRLFCVPGMTVDMTILPPLQFKNQNIEPKEQAYIAQLEMANSLGVLAIDRTNKDYFERQKAAKEERAKQDPRKEKED